MGPVPLQAWMGQASELLGTLSVCLLPAPLKHQVAPACQQPQSLIALLFITAAPWPILLRNSIRFSSLRGFSAITPHNAGLPRWPCSGPGFLLAPSAPLHSPCPALLPRGPSSHHPPLFCQLLSSGQGPPPALTPLLIPAAAPPPFPPSSLPHQGPGHEDVSPCMCVCVYTYVCARTTSSISC